MADHQPPPFYLLWFRQGPREPWVQVRRTATYFDAVLWIGVGHGGGDWLILPGVQRPLLPVGSADRHRFDAPVDVSHLRVNSPPPTDDECREWQRKRVAATFAAALEERQKRRPPPRSPRQSSPELADASSGPLPY